MATRGARGPAASLLVWFALPAGPPAVGGAQSSPAVDLSGRWTYNQALSDDVRERAREAMARRRSRAEGALPSGGGPITPAPWLSGEDGLRETMRAIREPAEEITVAQSEAEIVIDEAYGRRRSLHPDGRKYKTENGTAELETEWKQGRLVVETKGGRRFKVVERWELSAGRNRLVVDLRIEAGGGPALALKRVYERAAPLP